MLTYERTAECGDHTCVKDADVNGNLLLANASNHFTDPPRRSRTLPSIGSSREALSRRF